MQRERQTCSELDKVGHETNDGGARNRKGERRRNKDRYAAGPTTMTCTNKLRFCNFTEISSGARRVSPLKWRWNMEHIVEEK